MKSIFIVLLLFSLNSWGAPKVALVKLLRGQVEVQIDGKSQDLKIDDWVEEGTIIKTSQKSFVKLMFTDKSQMNIGPDSEMKIEKFNAKDAGVMEIVKGKVRSQISKDYLQTQDRDKSKLFIKTRNAVMGVRGTDFMVTTNGKNTATVLFEGEVVFSNLSDRNVSSTDKLEDMVDRGVRIMPGEFSVVEMDRSEPTVPSILNVKQREALETNVNFESDRTPSSSEEKSQKSVVPDGLSGQEVSNNSDTLSNEIEEASTSTEASSDKKVPDSKDAKMATTPEGNKATPGAPAPNNANTPKSDKVVIASPSNARGAVSGDTIKPANGSFLHLDSGVVIPPSADSVFDANTNSFISGTGNGKVSADGNFIPPKNVQITYDGKVLMTIPMAQGEAKVVEISKPSPVVASGSLSLTDISKAIAVNPNVIPSSGVMTINQPAPVTTLPTTTLAPPPTGGIDLNTAVIQRDSGRLNINVNR